MRKRAAKQVLEERRNAILEMHAVGVKQEDIVRYYGMPKSAVGTIILREGERKLMQEAMKSEDGNQNLVQDLFGNFWHMLIKIDSNHYTLLLQNTIHFDMYRSVEGQFKGIYTSVVCRIMLLLQNHFWPLETCIGANDGLAYTRHGREILCTVYS